MMMGLKENQEKMSKSVEDSAIFMEDTAVRDEYLFSEEGLRACDSPYVFPRRLACVVQNVERCAGRLRTAVVHTDSCYLSLVTP